MAHRILAKLAVVPNGPQECGVGPKMAASLMRISVDVHAGVSVSNESDVRSCGNKLRGSSRCCQRRSSLRHVTKISVSVPLRPQTQLIVCAPYTWAVTQLPTLLSHDVTFPRSCECSTNHCPTFGEGRAGGSFVLLAAGAPYICLTEILPGFLAYVPKHARRTKKSPIHTACKASCGGDGCMPAQVSRSVRNT